MINEESNDSASKDAENRCSDKHVDNISENRNADVMILTEILRQSQKVVPRLFLLMISNYKHFISLFLYEI